MHTADQLSSALVFCSISTLKEDYMAMNRGSADLTEIFYSHGRGRGLVHPRYFHSVNLVWGGVVFSRLLQEIQVITCISSY